ncbi:MAG TPA: hypothetical protein DCX27_10230 [Balneola sp.]|nr:hypothetical protein [Balneola sp.]|tara:strand:- start:1140 stop:1871 length:732 start_codon:yes stop_codon:yes gene_type:complete
MLHEIIKKTIPEYTCILPISKKEIKFRPLLVKEEKFISQINELSDLFSDRLYSLCKLVDSCCDNTIDSMQLPIYDFQYLLIDIRKRSITEETSMKIQCPYTGESVVVQINFNDLLKNVVVQSQTKEITIDNSTILKVGIPKIKDILDTLLEMTNDTDIMKLVASVLLELETVDKTIDLKTETKEEKLQMLESMNRDQYKIIKEYVMNGYFIMNLKYQTSDGTERKVKVSDFANFLRFYLGTLI